MSLLRYLQPRLSLSTPSQTEIGGCVKKAGIQHAIQDQESVKNN